MRFTMQRTGVLDWGLEWRAKEIYACLHLRGSYDWGLTGPITNGFLCESEHQYSILKSKLIEKPKDILYFSYLIKYGVNRNEKEIIVL